MPKFSIIIPVYNTEKYIEKCINSVLNQTFDNYEIIVINDGSTDGSLNILNKYKNIKIINQTNRGLSEARNVGVKSATGEYLLFLDSDDFIEKDLLKKINNSTKNNPDLVRFQLKIMTDNNEIINYYEKEFENKNGSDAFSIISSYHFVELAVCYAIKREFFLKENFRFKKDAYHEDFGLIPLIIMKAIKVNSISYIGYNYYQRSGSIMNSSNYQKTLKKVDDFYKHYLYLNNEINKIKINSKIFKSFISNSIILKITELNYKDYKKYLNLLKTEKVFDNLLDDTILRKIKKILVSISPKIYYKLKK